MTIPFQTFYKDFFKKSEGLGLRYVVPRNYESLPESKPGNDVDILIDKKQVKQFTETITSMLLESGGKLQIDSERFYVTKTTVLNVEDDQSKMPSTELDLITRLSWKGQNWLDEYTVLSESILNSNNIRIPAPRHELQMSLFHSLLYGKFVKRRYCEKMEQLFKICRVDALKTELYTKFGNESGKVILKHLESSSWDELEQKAEEIRRSLFLTQLRKNLFMCPTRYIHNNFKEIMVRIKH